MISFWFLLQTRSSNTTIFFVVCRQLFEGNDAAVDARGHRLDDLVLDLGVDVFSKVLQERTVVVLMKIFGEKENFVELQQLARNVQENVRFARVARTTDQHPENAMENGIAGCPCL